DDLVGHLKRVADEWAREAAAELGTATDHTHARAHLRYAGTDTALQVPLGSAANMIEDFEAAYRQRFSFLMPDKDVMVEAVSVEVVVSSGIDLTEDEQPAGEGVSRDEHEGPDDGPCPGSRLTPVTVAARAQVPMFTDDAWQQVPLYQREDLPAGQVITGPAI